MKKSGGSESTIIIGPYKYVLVYALHRLEYVLGLARFRVFVPKLLLVDPAKVVLIYQASFSVISKIKIHVKRLTNHYMIPIKTFYIGVTVITGYE